VLRNHRPGSAMPEGQQKKTDNRGAARFFTPSGEYTVTVMDPKTRKGSSKKVTVKPGGQNREQIKMP
jgi:hypothetical protein